MVRSDRRGGSEPVDRGQTNIAGQTQPGIGPRGGYHDVLLIECVRDDEVEIEITPRVTGTEIQLGVVTPFRFCPGPLTRLR